MAYKVLEQNGVTNENVDGAGFNYFASGKRDGILGGILSECAVYSPASNIVSIGTGVISVQGFRVKITSDISWAVSGNADEYSIIFEIILNPDRSVSSQFIAQSSSLNLIKDDLLVDEKGTHQIEVIRFNWDGGAVSNISRRLPVIIAGSGGGGASIELAQDVEGDSTEKAVSQKAVKDALDGKLNALPVTAGYWAYVTTPKGHNARLYLSGNENAINNIPLYIMPKNSNTEDKGATINVTMPVHPYNAANRRFVESITDPLQKDVRILKSATEGSLYEVEELNGGTVFASIPEEWMKAITLNQLGPSVNSVISVVERPTPVSDVQTDADSGVTITYDPDTEIYTLNGGGEGIMTSIELNPISLNFMLANSYTTLIEVVGGSYTSEYGSPLRCQFRGGDSMYYTSVMTVENGVGSASATDDLTAYVGTQITHLELNISVDLITFNNLQIKLYAPSANTDVSFVPITAMRVNDSVIYEVPEAVRNLKRNGSPVYGIGCTVDGVYVYNYIDFDTKEFVVNVIDEGSRFTPIPEERIDISAYLGATAGEITLPYTPTDIYFDSADLPEAYMIEKFFKITGIAKLGG